MSSLAAAQSPEALENSRLAESEMPQLLETDDEWSPYLSVEGAYRLDDVREALRRGDLEAAAKHGRVFAMTPVAV